VQQLGAYAGSVGYNTVDTVDNYVKHQEDLHQRKLEDFTGSPALKCWEDVTSEKGKIYKSFKMNSTLCQAQG